MCREPTTNYIGKRVTGTIYAREQTWICVISVNEQRSKYLSISVDLMVHKNLLEVLLVCFTREGFTIIIIIRFV